MYNADVKERFLSSLLANRTRKVTAGALRFDDLAEYEQMLGKDFAEMTREESLSALQRLEFLEYRSVETVISELKAYVTWCKEAGAVKSWVGGFLDVKPEDYDPAPYMAKVYFRDEYDFLYSLRKVREFNELYVEVVLLALSWLGLGLRESLELKESSVDLDARVIYDSDGKVLVSEISDGIAHIFSLFRQTKVAYRENGNTTFEVKKDLSHDVFVKRVCPSGSSKFGIRLSEPQAISAVTRLNTDYHALGFEFRFAPVNVRRSGALYRLWQAEQSGLNILDKANKTEVERIYGFSQYRKIAWQYKHYKRAFNL